jgi:hypothetical protein
MAKLCQRLKFELERDACQLRPLDSFDERRGDLQRLRAELQHLRAVSTPPNVIVPLRASSADMALRIWESVREALAGTPAPVRRIIVLLVVPPGQAFPEGVVALPAPNFSATHAHQWARAVVDALGAEVPERSSLHAFLKEQLVTKCGEEHGLGVELVYRFVSDVERWLQEQLSIDDLRARIEEWI